MTYFDTCLERHLQFGIKMSWAVNGQAAYKDDPRRHPRGWFRVFNQQRLNMWTEGTTTLSR